MASITIVNRHTYNGPFIYCGRGTPFGNRYSHKVSAFAVYKVNTREEAIAFGRNDFYNRLVEGNDFQLLRCLAELIYRYQNGDDLILACSCKPLPCHLDYIKEGIEDDSFYMIPKIRFLVDKLYYDC